MKNLLILLLFTSCISQKKVNRWLDEHPTDAAGYCADNFPPDTTDRIQFIAVDSSGYEQAYSNMATYADSLFYRLDSIQNAPRSPLAPCPPKINLDSLRKDVDREIRRRLIPCVDSIVHVNHIVIDKAQERHLRGVIEQKDATITARDNRITQLEGKVKARDKWIWLFFTLAALNGLYVLLKLKRKIPF